MQMDEGLDTGPVFTRHALDIGSDETAGELAARLGSLAGEVVVADVPRVVEGTLQAAPQNEGEATHAPPLKKEDGRIAWARPAKAVHDHVRGMHPWPGAFTHAADKVLKVIATHPARFEAQGAEPGTILAADSNGVVIACQDGTLELLRAQIEGRKPLSARELVSGRTLRAGMKLGSPP
jgi:methionyl-tRNA formyltransferase